MDFTKKEKKYQRSHYVFLDKIWIYVSCHDIMHVLFEPTPGRCEELFKTSKFLERILISFFRVKMYIRQGQLRWLRLLGEWF